MSCQQWSLHGFQALNFICDWFGCKFWLQLIQNHAWHRLQAFARRHLKSLRCSIQRPFLRQVVDSDLLLCTGFDSEHAVLFLCHILTQRPMNDGKVRRIDGRCLGRRQWSATTSRRFHENFISHGKQKVTCSNPKFTTQPEVYKTLLTLELSRYRKSGSMFSSSEPVVGSSDCRRLGNALCSCSPVLPAQA